MRLNKYIIGVILSLISLASCIEPFSPAISLYEDMLIIEGYLTDDPDDIDYVKISSTLPISGNKQAKSIPVSGATVTIECSDGNIYQLNDDSSGKYLDDAMLLEPEEGKLYKLRVELNGDIFESDQQSYIPSPEPDSITWKHKVVKDYINAEEIDGLQFYIHSSSSADSTIYLRWSLETTYKYYAPLDAQYVFHNGAMVEFYSYIYKTCWNTYDLPGIFIASSEGLAQNIIADVPLNFVSQNGYMLSERYSLLAKQHTISKTAYKFWYDVNKTINESGGLYESIPIQVSGNIRCINNPDTRVTGIFEVSGISEKRVFVDRPEEFPINIRICRIDTVGSNALPWHRLKEGDYFMEPKEDLFLHADSECFICTLIGGSTEKPDFWEDY